MDAVGQVAPSLRSHLDPVGPDARIYALGGKVDQFLTSRGLRTYRVLLHYSAVAQHARKKVGERYLAELAALQAVVKLNDILQTAEQVLAAVPARLRARSPIRLALEA